MNYGQYSLISKTMEYQDSQRKIFLAGDQRGKNQQTINNRNYVILSIFFCINFHFPRVIENCSYSCTEVILIYDTLPTRLFYVHLFYLSMVP